MKKLRKSPRGKLSLITEELPPLEVSEQSPEKTTPKTQSWDSKLRSIVGPIEPSPVKRSPAKKRQRIGGPKAKESPVKAAKPLTPPKETEPEATQPEPEDVELPLEEPNEV
jgi:hypothetical protein